MKHIMPSLCRRCLSVALLYCYTLLAMAKDDMHMTLRQLNCGNLYSTVSWDNLYVEYDGQYIESPCSIDIENDDNINLAVCISTDVRAIGCGTTIEYHEGFISSFTTGMTVSCDNRHPGVWCSDEYTTNVFIVLKSDRYSSASFTLRVHTKYLTSATERFFQSGINIFLVAMSPAVFIAIVMTISCYCCYKHTAKTERARRARFQATLETVTLEAGRRADTPTQSPHGYQISYPTDHLLDHSDLPRDCVVHQIRRAEPVVENSGEATRNHPLTPQASYMDENTNVQSYRQQQPSAPTLNQEEELPPSYDSLWRKQH